MSMWSRRKGQNGKVEVSALPWKPILIVGLLVIPILLAAFLVTCASRELAIDQCLDAGGRWLNVDARCDFGRAAEVQDP